MELVFTLSEIDNAVQSFLAQLKPAAVIAFHGEMGAGKTTFISCLCKALGVANSTSSPTFSIINHYTTSSSTIIYHMDWYRLRDEEEAIQAGVEDALYSGNMCLVEWPERAAALLPDETLHVYLQALDSQTRKLSDQQQN